MWAVGLWLGMLAVSAWAIGPDELEYWSRLRFPQELLFSFLNDDSCYSEKEYFASCAKALNAVRTELNLPELNLNFAKTNTSDLPDQTKSDRLSFIQEIESLIEQTPSNMPRAALEVTAVNAHLGHFDSHARIMAADQFSDLQSANGANYKGLGIQIDQIDGHPFLLDVYPNGPAAQQGLKAGDELLRLQFDNEPANDVTNKSSIEVNQLFGTGDYRKLKIRIARAKSREQKKLGQLNLAQENENREIIDFEVAPGAAYAPILSTQMVKPDIGYLGLRSFDYDETCTEVADGIKTLQAAGAEKLILDLRGNGGGLQFMAVCVASLFVDASPVMGSRALISQIPRLGQYVQLREPIDTENIDWVDNYSEPISTEPLVVLVDEDTASASEILANALTSHKRAKLVGERTFGKGSVQEYSAMKDYSDFRLAHTAALLLTPEAKTTDGIGIVPDIELTSMELSLSKAIEILNSMDHPTGGQK